MGGARGGSENPGLPARGDDGNRQNLRGGSRPST